MESHGGPLFSVIIPLYNKERYIDRALGSVLSQSEQDFEIIVVDDGSTDDGGSIAKAVFDPKVKVFAQINQGVASARNKGMTLATGGWVAFLDADDLWSPDHLAELRRIITHLPDIGMVASTSREVIEGADVQFLGKTSRGSLRRINYFDEASKDIGVINTSSCAVKRSVFHALGVSATIDMAKILSIGRVSR